MSDLSPDAVREVIDWWNWGDGLEVTARYDLDDFNAHFAPLFEAARLWLASRSGPSDKEVERAAEVIYQGTYQGHRDRQALLDHVRAALVAARQGVDDA